MLLLTLDIILRPLEIADSLSVSVIEAAVSPAPWAESVYIDMIKAGYLGWVLEYEKEIMGFIFISLAADECQIINLAVKPGWQKQGLGTSLIKHTLKYAKQQGAELCYLEVRRSNQTAQILYNKLGFTIISTRKDYYTTQGGREDAIIMRCHLRSENHE